MNIFEVQKKELEQFDYILNDLKNMNNVTYDTFKVLREYIDSPLYFQQDYRIQRSKAQAQLLYEMKSQVLMITDPSKYDKFEKLGSSIFGDPIEAYKLADEIIFDLHIARDWISSFLKFQKELQLIEGVVPGASHEELLTLGKAILGRATELCPIKTGKLRKSGYLIDYGHTVEIGFNADYALYVHDNLNNKHDVGRAKFLEVAVQEIFPHKTVWVEHLGYKKLYVTISINPKTVIEYMHYN